MPKRIRPEEYIGKKFGRLTVLSLKGSTKGGHRLAQCQCDCGTQKSITVYRLRTGGTKSCGCWRSDVSRRTGRKNGHDLTGRTFGKLTVLRRDKEADKDSNSYQKPRWMCRCECGTVKSIRSSNLTNGTIQSCGCLTRRTGKDHPGWKGGRSMRDGYVLLSIYENGKKRVVSEHRYVMEQHLGRKLKPNENVHHRNGKRDDNRLSNLELWVKTQPCGQRIPDIIDFCVSFLAEYAPEKLKGVPSAKNEGT